jgi:hypothetical protein
MGQAQQPRTLRLPFPAIAANAAGTLMLAAGVAALVVPNIAQLAPPLADRYTAWTLVLSGLVLDIWSVLTIVKAVRRH